MKLFLGCCVILMNFSIFTVTLIYTLTEWNEVIPFKKVLDEKIDVNNVSLSQNSYITDENGHIISEIYEQNRVYLPYDQVPEYVMKAFIATEDQHFFEHKGFDVIGILRALATNIEQNEIAQGGSTISQQLVRNLYFSNERTYNRKLSELLYAYQFEKKWSKQEIFELYINTIYFGNNAYGIEAASNTYFQKSAAELTLAEIAFLTAIPNNPTYYDPVKHINNTHTRKNWVLAKMLEEHYITREEYELALNEKINLNMKQRIDRYPNYVTYVHEELKQLIADKENISDRTTLEQRAAAILQSGVIIETALSPSVQEHAVATVANMLSGELEGAAVIIDHTTNEIRALVGGKHYEKFSFHRAFQAVRQPGSAIKPLLVFGPYIEELNKTPRDRISANRFCKNGYCPENFSRRNYGNVTLKQALAFSYNTAAVRMLDTIGVDTAFSYLNKLNFSHIQPEDYRLPAAIGGFTYGMTPLELTAAFTVFSNNGAYMPARAIKKVTDGNGNILYQWNDSYRQIWSEKTNDRMQTLLQSVVTEGTGKKAYIHGVTKGGKTGTTNEFKDLWFIGYSSTYTIGVWIGKDNPASLHSESSQALHLRLWKELMKGIH